MNARLNEQETRIETGPRNGKNVAMARSPRVLLLTTSKSQLDAPHEAASGHRLAAIRSDKARGLVVMPANIPAIP